MAENLGIRGLILWHTEDKNIADRKKHYQEEGKEAQELRHGDVVNIPVGVKHWHGAAKDSWFSHLAVEVPGENGSNEWLEAVDDGIYNSLK